MDRMRRKVVIAMGMKKVLSCVLVGVVIAGSIGISASAVEMKQDVLTDHVIEMKITRATGSFNMTVPAKSTLRADDSFPLEVGETVTIKAAYSPFSASVDFGLVDSDGIFHYLRASNGTFDKTIEIEERGSYIFAVRNNSSSSVSVSGYVNY